MGLLSLELKHQPEAFGLQRCFQVPPSSQARRIQRGLGRLWRQELGRRKRKGWPLGWIK